MKRVLVGVIGVVVLAAAGFFGVRWYAQHRAERELETAFDQIRSTGAKASHGKVTFDLWTRTLTVADISSESASQPPVVIKIGNFTASGLNQPDSAHVAASSIDIDNLELNAQLAAPTSWHIIYTAPKVTLKDYRGPSKSQGAPVSGSLIDVYGFLIKQFADVSASSLTMPSVVGKLDFGKPATGLNDGNFSYAGFSVQGIKDGKVASYKLDDMTFTITMMEAGKPNTMSGHVTNLAAQDVDANAIAAVLDPAKANDDHVYQAYRQVSTGPYEINAAQGFQMRMDGFKIENVGFRPSKMKLQALLAAMPQPGAPPSPAQFRALTDTMAGFYEGMQVGNAEINGITVATPGGPVKLAMMRSDLNNGKANIAVEGLDGRAPQGPIKLGRFALKSLDLAGLMRISAQYADPLNRPPPGKALDLLSAIGGIEVKDVVAPYKATTKSVKIDAFNFDWGQFVGPIPTKAHLAAKMAGPIDASDPVLLPLLAAGIDTLAVDADVGLGWTEASSSLALTPGKIEISNIASVSLGVSLADVPRTLFTPDPQQAMAAAAAINAGPLEVTVHDLGGVDLLIAQFARAHTIDRDAAKQQILDDIKATGTQMAADNPEAANAVDAIGRFIETPHQTLTLKLTPKAKVPVMQLFQLMNADPSLALPQFKIEASTGL